VGKWKKSNKKYSMILPKDLMQIKAMDLTESQIEEQLSYFINGIPFMKIKAPATVEKGILRLTKEQQNGFIRIWDEYLTGEKQIIKFVPASGAASRMFKDLFSFLRASCDTPTTDFEKLFFERITDFAFYEALDNVCRLNERIGVSELIAKGRYKDVVSNLIEKKGLDYGSLPKGLLLFHYYPNCPRTAMEEHLVEGALYAKNIEKRVTIHFTVLPAHQPLFEQLLEEKRSQLEERFAVKYDIFFSTQQSNTDTIAVDMANAPIRDVHGRLVFRPGGHGSLIQNLNALDADVVFIKNIDSVTPDTLKKATVRYKKVIAGILVALQKQIFDYIRLIESGDYTHNQIEEMLYFLQNELCIKNPETKYLEDVELVLYIKRKLMRPLRVCGMVKNENEPGGGPFLAFNPDGTVSPQVLESFQIDLNNPESKRAFEQVTHFNPVDLVCALKDINGKKYHLPDYVDKNACLITIKSKDGRDLKALELPGLWNGSMSDWNTVFVEVPIETFNPVKTVNDLLRPQHQ
jgi:hypothetical protein